METLLQRSVEAQHPAALHCMAERALREAVEKGSSSRAASKYWKKAVSYYESAAALGHPPSLCQLGAWYRDGFPEGGIAQDYYKALDYYTEATELDYVDAWKELAVFYDQGLGVMVDKAHAAYLVDLAQMVEQSGQN